MSPRVAISGIRSAGIYRSAPFSVCDTNGRFASATSMPPNLRR